MTTPQQDQIIANIIAEMEQEGAHDLVFRIGRPLIREAMETAVERCVNVQSQQVTHNVIALPADTHDPTQFKQGDTSKQSLGESADAKACNQYQVEGSEATSVSLADGENSPSVYVPQTTPGSSHQDKEVTESSKSYAKPEAGSVSTIRAQSLAPTKSEKVAESEALRINAIQEAQPNV